jgi:hypothetical protein
MNRHYPDRLARVALFGRELLAEERPPAKLRENGCGRFDHLFRDLKIACLIGIGCPWLGRALVSLRLDLLRGLGRLGPLALATLEVVVRFA